MQIDYIKISPSLLYRSYRYIYYSFTGMIFNEHTVGMFVHSSELLILPWQALPSLRYDITSVIFWQIES